MCEGKLDVQSGSHVNCSFHSGSKTAGGYAAVDDSPIGDWHDAGCEGEDGTGNVGFVWSGDDECQCSHCRQHVNGALGARRDGRRPRWRRTISVRHADGNSGGEAVARWVSCGDGVTSSSIIIGVSVAASA